MREREMLRALRRQLRTVPNLHGAPELVHSVTSLWATCWIPSHFTSLAYIWGKGSQGLWIVVIINFYSVYYVARTLLRPSDALYHGISITVSWGKHTSTPFIDGNRGFERLNSLSKSSVSKLDLNPNLTVNWSERPSTNHNFCLLNLNLLPLLTTLLVRPQKPTEFI